MSTMRCAPSKIIQNFDDDDDDDAAAATTTPPRNSELQIFIVRVLAIRNFKQAAGGREE